MSKEIKALLWDVESQEVKEVTISNYKDYYKLIGCDLLTVVSTDFGDIYLDDEGLLERGNKVTRLLRGDEEGIETNPAEFLFAVGYDNMTLLAGNLVLVGHVDGDGYNTDVTITPEEFREHLEVTSLRANGG